MLNELHIGVEGEPYCEPEPCTGVRFERIMRRIDAALQAHPDRPADRICPLELHCGRHTACTGAPCLFYGVPGLEEPCAIEHLAPHLADEPALADWFIELRDVSASR